MATYNLTTLTGTQSVNNQPLSDLNPSNTYAFDLLTRRPLTITLDNLSANADVVLWRDINANRILEPQLDLKLADPRRGGTETETIVFDEISGASYIAEVVRVDRDVNYRLRLQTTGPDRSDPVFSGQVYRIYDPLAGAHVYTRDLQERNELVAKGYRDEGAAFDSAGVNEIFRFYNRDTGTYFYTNSAFERDYVIANLGGFEYLPGRGFQAYSNPTVGTIPVYRFYNLDASTHFYTTSDVERDFVIANLGGFRYEGIGYYADPLG